MGSVGQGIIRVVKPTHNYTKMDSIRKKMQALKYETDGMIKNTEDFETQTQEHNRNADQCECDIRDFTKKISKLEGAFEETLEKLTKTNTDLDEKKVLMQETELSALSRRTCLLEDESQKSEIKLAKATLELGLDSKRADKVIKIVNSLTSKSMNDEMEIETLSNQEREAKFMQADSEKKFDEISRRLGVMEEELKRAEERADNCHRKVASIDDELKIVGENMKQLEVEEEKALKREEKFKDQILALIDRLKFADGRAEYGEMNITKLNQRIDGIEDDIVREKVKGQHVSNEMSDTFRDMIHKF